ncbi:protein kinase domain-containing protein [Nocardia abscessus]|uniref:protein kinase domain-containing protein n=1 Tax=Nocardia abscessus TaxID=120957 RepID=UPI0024556E15|nr:protein kinase [Nocardia abscessus]
MTGDDPSHTRRAVSTPITAELDAAGFEDAVQIGRGGFGVVYRCWQPELDRTVAVKVLTADLDADNQARFLREQRAMGRLTGHPNITTVLEVGATAGGHPFLVMPYHALDSLDAWIRTHGSLTVENVLVIGVKIAGALAGAHRLGIVHRDVKPGNILLTEYGEPTLSDFGIAHIAGGFETASGMVTGSPAFIAPEVLEGNPPTPAADVYGLAATLFCALTGHAAFERRSGENVVTQFLRIASQPVPDLREGGIPEDVAALVETAMSRDSHERPTAEELGQAIRRIQRHHGFPVGAMALRTASDPEGADKVPARGHRPPDLAADASGGNLPLELTSFINRRAELAEVRNLLSTSRLVTLTGIGGVGKTRLALHAASRARRDFADGVWLVELADVSDASLLVDMVAATLGLRDESATPLLDTLVAFLNPRQALLVVDNCEQVVDAVAELTGTVLRTCSDVRILLTSRESLNIAGEAVLRVPPLAVPDPDHEPTLRALPSFDAVTLFADRAAAAVPGFAVDEGNKTAVARICARLDGLPLAIELAAARLRSLSPQQILTRLTDRYALLTRGSRGAPSRQQTLRWCMDWSYELCTRAEQRLWARLSVFAGTFELDAAEQVCGADPIEDPEPDAAGRTLLDVLSSLVDKSILVRQDSDTVVLFRMLETLRDYGREKLRASGEYARLRRRHRDWYHHLALEAEDQWISHRQPDWIARLEREQPNLREALEAFLAEDTEEAATAGLRTAAALFEFWAVRGLFGEGRSWLDRVLAHPAARSVPDRVKALRVGSQLAVGQSDFHSAAALMLEARALDEKDGTSATHIEIAYGAGALALARGDPARASSALERAIELLGAHEPGTLLVSALTSLGLSCEMCGDVTRAVECYRDVLAITEARGESLGRSVALRGIGVAVWRQGDRETGRRMLEEALRVNRRVNSPVIAALVLEAMAWIVADEGGAEPAAVLMGAAQGLWPADGFTTVFARLSGFHEECERTARRALGAQGFDAALRRGRAMDIGAAMTFALGNRPTDTPPSGASAKLTKRERQVADLVAQGLSNRQIAARLVISQRTAQGHVEHILTKLGFTSRAQIAAWVAVGADRENP